jgi:hypothetical protein
MLCAMHSAIYPSRFLSSPLFSSPSCLAAALAMSVCHVLVAQFTFMRSGRYHCFMDAITPWFTGCIRAVILGCKNFTMIRPSSVRS